MINFIIERLVERKLREKLKDDRARIQFGRISNFGLTRNDQTKIKRKFSKMEYDTLYRFFCLKVVKKAEELAFSNKAKIINA